MLFTCVSIVFGLRKSFAQIALFERPSAIRPEHLALARCQLGERVVLGAAPEELRDDLGVDRGSAAPDAVHRVEEVVELDDPVLEQVAEPLGRLAEEPERVARLDDLRRARGCGARGARPGARSPPACPRR